MNNFYFTRILRFNNSSALFILVKNKWRHGKPSVPAKEQGPSINVQSIKPFSIMTSFFVTVSANLYSCNISLSFDMLRYCLPASTIASNPLSPELL